MRQVLTVTQNTANTGHPGMSTQFMVCWPAGTRQSTEATEATTTVTFQGAAATLLRCYRGGLAKRSVDDSRFHSATLCVDGLPPSPLPRVEAAAAAAFGESAAATIRRSHWRTLGQ